MTKIKKVIIHPTQELNHFSYIHTMLYDSKELEIEEKLFTQPRKGVIRISNDLLTLLPNRFHEKTSIIDVILSNDKRLKIGFDLYDLSSDFSLWALKNCDYLFKRNLNEEHIELLKREYQGCKIMSFTWNFGCKTVKSFSLKIILGFVLFQLKDNTKINRYFFRNIKKNILYSVGHIRQVAKRRSIEYFRQIPEEVDTVSNRILFQSRCFSDLDLNSRHIQDFRSKVIQLLKLNFPKDFVGGFIPDPTSIKLYPNLVTRQNTSPIDYLNLLKSSDIVIYTEGLNHSPAWKFAEYASQGKVIVAQRFQFSMPFDIVDGEDVIFFDTPKELFDIITKLKNSEKLKQSLRKNIREKFNNYMDPKSAFKLMEDVIFLA